MKKISKYRTADGKEFDNQADAKVHENEIVALQGLFAVLKTSLTTGRADGILKHILYEEEQIREILLAYRRRLPKTETANTVNT